MNRSSGARQPFIIFLYLFSTGLNAFFFISVKTFDTDTFNQDLRYRRLQKLYSAIVPKRNCSRSEALCSAQLCFRNPCPASPRLQHRVVVNLRTNLQSKKEMDGFFAIRVRRSKAKERFTAKEKRSTHWLAARHEQRLSPRENYIIYHSSHPRRGLWFTWHEQDLLHKHFQQHCYRSPKTETGKSCLRRIVLRNPRPQTSALLFPTLLVECPGFGFDRVEGRGRSGWRSRP